MTGQSAKDKMISVIDEQPDDATFEGILRELAIARMIERGLADSDAMRDSRCVSSAATTGSVI